MAPLRDEPLRTSFFCLRRIPARLNVHGIDDYSGARGPRPVRRRPRARARCDCTVIIYVNNTEVHLHRGRYDVATLKRLSSVPLADDLDELVDNKLKPIPDDATVQIEGCEVFISHVKDGGSS